MSVPTERAVELAGGVRALLSSEPPALRLEHSGRTLVATAAGDAWPDLAFAARRDGEWAPAPGVRLDAEEGGVVRVRLEAAGADAVSLALASVPGERYYGFGERFDRLDQRGRVLELWVKNGASGGDTYKPVPFLLSSRGYGIALETSCRVHASLAHPSLPQVASLVVEADAVEALVIPGPAMADVLRAYTELVGRPRPLPAWALLPWKSRDWRVQSQATVEDDLERQREHGLPCGVALVDASWEREEHTFAFDPERYPDPERLIGRAAGDGARVVLWISPSMTAGTDAHREAAERGFLIRDPAGEVYVHDLGNAPGWLGTTIDFTNPAAVEWFQQRLRALLELGIGGFKTDFGEQVPEDAVFANGGTGRELHNLLPVLYNRAAWEVVREFDGVLLARSAWAGSQGLSAVWAGDQSSDFNPWSGLPSAIVAGQAAGLSGFPYWGSDVGGYFGEPDAECFARWAQFAALTPIMEVHGLGVREPWLLGPEALEIYRRYATLHARLVPYTLAAAVEAEQSGLPLLRAMALAFPDDPCAGERWLDYQYLYGPDLLVAPVYSWGDSRQVRFPAGAWTGFFDGERHRGPATGRVPAPLDTLPLFVRAGALLPLLEDPATPVEQALVLEAYPAARASCERRLPDGTRLVLHAGRAHGRLVASGPRRRYTLRLHGAALAGGHEISWTGDAELAFELADERGRAAP